MNWKKLKTLSKLTILTVVVGGTLIAVVGAGLVTRYPLYDSDYCGTCHEELYALWLESNGHAPEHAGCPDCHAENMLWKEKQYSAAAEHLLDRCLACHEEVPEQEKAERDRIRITHKQHISGLDTGKMDCLDCHRELAHSFNRNATNRPSMTGCYAAKCHPVEKETCKTCHFVEMTFGAENDTASCERIGAGASHWPPAYIESGEFR